MGHYNDNTNTGKEKNVEQFSKLYIPSKFFFLSILTEARRGKNAREDRENERESTIVYIRKP